MARIELSGPQHEIAAHAARFKVVCAGRRFGKTTLALAMLLHRAARPGALCWYVAPTYRQAHQIAWEMLHRLIPPSWARTANATDLTITFAWGSKLSLRGADNPDSLRGVGLDYVVLDEYADMGPEAWTHVLRPALADRQGEALFIGTPKGYNHFYDLWVAAHSQTDWHAWAYTTMDGGNVPKEEIEASRAELDARIFKQEYLASFETLSDRVYQEFERGVHVRVDVEDIQNLPLLVGMDFNVNPMSAVLAVKPGGQLHVFGEIEIPNGNTEIMAQEIRRRFGGRQIRVYPDPSGNARKTSAPVGQTDFAILRSAGFQVISPSHAPLIADRINEVNAVFRSASGEVRCYVSPKARMLIRCLEGLTWKEGTSIPDKTLGLDHMADAFGYLVHSEYPIVTRHAWSQEFRL